jgi:hypothetical protein
VSAGLVPTFISHQLWMAPMTALIIYVLVGHRRARETGTMFEFADSAYYLGFTLSIGSLLASLEPFNTVKRPDPERIFHYFGLGLLTTLVGVVARTMLQTYYRPPVETFEEVNRRVTSEAARYLEHLQALTRDVVGVLGTTTTHLDQQVLPRLNRLTTALDTTVQQLEATAQAGTSLTMEVGAANMALKGVVSGYAESVGSVQTVHAVLAESVNGLSNDIGAARKAVLDASPGFDGLRDSVRTISSELGELSRRLGGVTVEQEPLRRSIEFAGETVRIAGEAARQQVTSLETVVSQFSKNIDAMQTAAVAIADPGLRTALEGLESRVKDLGDAVAAQKMATTNEVETLRSTTRAALEATQQVANTLDEIARATTMSLARDGASRR